jgi:NAD(P)H dehydrogenase (quinone)
MADVNVLVAFYSRNGSTEALAKAVAEGARAERAEVRLRRAREIVSEQIMAKLRAGLKTPSA